MLLVVPESCHEILPMYMEVTIYATISWVIKIAKAGTARSLLDPGHDVDAKLSGQHANAAAGMSTSQMPMLGLSSHSAVLASLQREHPMHPPLVAANLSHRDPNAGRAVTFEAAVLGCGLLVPAACVH